MTDDIVSLLQDLGKENSVDVIANFIIRNPDVEELIAAKMGSLLSAPETDSPTTVPTTNSSSNSNTLPGLANSPIATLGLALSGGSMHKMIFVVNMDLNMGRGKQCAQVAHAALGLFLDIQQSGNEANQSKLNQWLMLGQKKIVVKANNLQHIKTLQQQADAARLPNHLVSDAGCTQIAPGSKTVLAIFGTNEELDLITGSLKLL